MNRLIAAVMPVEGIPCLVTALEEESRIREIHVQDPEKLSLLGNIYVGYVEKVARNIGAAFVRLSKEVNAYLPLSEEAMLIHTNGYVPGKTLRPGDEILVQVSRDAMKEKLPSVTANLCITGKYLAMTSGKKKTGISRKLSQEDRSRLQEWADSLENEDPPFFGMILRTNAAKAASSDLQEEYDHLRTVCAKVFIDGKGRTAGSLLYRPEPAYIQLARDIKGIELDEIVTDDPEVFRSLQEYASRKGEKDSCRVRFYEDRLLPLFKLCRLESVLEEACQQKVWLKSGGFLVIQQTEAFVAVDVNTGKYTDKKDPEESYFRMNLEAAKEIAVQLRLRNLSGIILVDFINMKDPARREQLFQVFQDYLKKDPVLCRAVDFTALQILEATRKKIRRPLFEELRDLGKNS